MTSEMRHALDLTLVGFGIVFVVLWIIALAVALVRRVDERWQRREQADEVARRERPPALDATTAIVIAAVAATVVGGRHRIRSVRRLLAPERRGTTWSAQGRAVLQGSHVITRRSR